MSSAILYLAIVAIWAVVLVPRWLRPRAAPPVPVPVPAESPDADLREPADPGLDAVTAKAVSSAAGGAGESTGDEVVGDVSGEEAAEDAPEAEVAAPAPALRRSEVLKARRRLLTTLITLTVIAAGLAVTGIDAYWIVIPPTVLLTGYVVLLRQFAHIDAERARRAARIRRARAQAEREPASAPAIGASDLGSDAPAALGGAEIIDISGRIGDQVYDQYSDAANRAVGD